MIIASPLMAQVRQERDFERSFSVPENAKVEVVSKYGEVIVRTWELDSIRFEVVNSCDAYLYPGSRHKVD